MKLGRYFLIFFILTASLAHAQIFHPENIFIDILPEKFSLQLDLDFEFSYFQETSLRLGQEGMIFYKENGFVIGAVDQYDLQFIGEENIDHRGALDLRYYQQWLDFLYTEVFAQGLFDQATGIDCLILGGAGPGFNLLKLKNTAYINLTLLYLYGLINTAESELFSHGTIISLPMLFQIVDNIRFENTAYCQALIPSFSLFQIINESILSFDFSKELSFSIKYLIIYEPLRAEYNFQHRVYSQISISI